MEDTTCTTDKSTLMPDQDELCFAGRHIFAGYLGDAKTAKAKILPDGTFFRSGTQGAKYKQLILVSRRFDNHVLMKSGQNRS